MTSSASSAATEMRYRSLGIDLVAIRRGRLVRGRLEPEGRAAARRRRVADDQAAGLVRVVGPGMRDDRLADRGGQRRRRRPGMVSHRRGSPPVDAAFEGVFHVVEVGRERAGREVLPAAVGEQRDDRAATSSSSASRAAATSTAPHDGPAKIPSRNTSSRSAAMASRFETRYFASISDGSRISGTNPSSSERRPWTSSPGSGSAATIRTPGLCSRR